MASPPLVLPGVLFVGEDERARIVAHTGAAAGWHVPKGILAWSTEVSVVAREALTDEIRRNTKLVMPEEQIPPAKMPLTAQAAAKSPLVAVSSKLVPKLVEAGLRVHTVGVDRITSSFYYLAEGGGEDEIRIEGDLVQAVGQMLGERADNAAIERVLDGLPDRLLRSLSKDRVSELTVELAAALPRAAADGSGTQEVELEVFEKNLAQLLGNAEKYTSAARELAAKLAETNERRLEVPLFGEARKVSQGPFDITVGERRVSLPTYERWVMSGPLAESNDVEAVRALLAGKAPTNPPRAASSPPAAGKADDDPLLANLRETPKVDAAAQKAAAERAAAEKKAAEEKAAAEKRAAEKAAAEKKAAEEKAAAEKKAAEEKAAAEKKAAEEKAAAEKKAAEEKAAEEKAAAEKKAAEEKAAEEKAAEEKVAEEKAAAEKKAAEAKEADDKEADEKKAEQKKRDEKVADKAAKSAVDTVKIRRKDSEKSGGMAWIAVLLVIAAAVAAWRLWFSH
ncbi:MAG: hypothetical protein KF819_04860 [Labilithrix sp.]|nr:hypothetical protein [Labilithrix sp.]